MPPVVTLLAHLTRLTAGEEADTAYSGMVERAAAGTDADVLLAYTRCSRLPGAPLKVPPGADTAAQVAPGLDWSAWTVVDAVRARLLLEAIGRRTGAAGPALARACYDAADATEQQSWLRSVSLLPDAAQYLSLVIDACRTNVVPVFTAVANGNPYPAAHFPERNFNQLVLKALFNGVPLAQIVGLERRRNPELARMAADYAAERRAAGRTVPDDIGLAL